MNGLNGEDLENIIQVEFNTEFSKSLSGEFVDLDDPLEDLLTEFDSVEQECEQVKEDYIHHLRNVECPKIDMDETALEMSEDIIKNIQRAKESFNRLKYYLDEFNIEG